MFAEATFGHTTALTPKVFSDIALCDILMHPMKVFDVRFFFYKAYNTILYLIKVKEQHLRRANICVCLSRFLQRIP